MKNLLSLLIIFTTFLAFQVQGGLIALGICYTGCNAVWAACYAAAGSVAGTVTAGAGIPVVIVGCNTAQGACMTACSVALALPTP